MTSATAVGTFAFFVILVVVAVLWARGDFEAMAQLAEGCEPYRPTSSDTEQRGSQEEAGGHSGEDTLARIRQLLRSLQIEQAVIWGHPLHSHTHSYIHEAWYDACRRAGLDTTWVPRTAPGIAEPLRQPDRPFLGSTARTLFITEGQVCRGLPSDHTSYYVLHNVDGLELPGVDRRRQLREQVYNRRQGQPEHGVPVFDQWHRYDWEQNACYHPWATNLLPHQFQYPAWTPRPPKEARQSFRATVVGQEGATYAQELQRFRQGLGKSQWVHRYHLGQQNMVEELRRADVAPALVCQFQKDINYIPCRILKNVSYGLCPVTTSAESHALLHSQTLYHEDEGTLAGLAKRAMLSTDGDLRERAGRARRLVQDRHTYLNRLEFLLTCLSLSTQPKLQRLFTRHVPLDRLRVLHLTCHRGCEAYVQQLAKRQAWDLQTWFLPDRPGDFGGNAAYNQTRERAQEFWDRWGDALNRVDLVLVSDTAPLARGILQNLKQFQARLLVWVCNRFDYVDREALAPGEEFPDPAWGQLLAEATRSHPSQVRVVSYTALERRYALEHGVDWSGRHADLVLRPVPRYEPEQSEQPQLQKVADSPIPDDVVRPDTWFIPPYTNDQECLDLAFLSPLLEVPLYRGRYAGPDDLVDFAAILHVPYAPSNLALFENWARGLVYYIPTLPFLTRLTAQTNHWFSGDQSRADSSEWYCAAHRHLFVYFDSWEHLRQLVAERAHLPLRAQVKEYAERLYADQEKTWSVVTRLW